MQIDGLITGLDSNAIVTQLMDIEARPMLQLAARRDTAQSALDAFSSVRSRLTSLASAASDLSRSSAWNARSATSSNAAIASVTVASGAPTSSISFTVDAVAKAHGIASDVVAATSTVVSAGGTLNLTVGGDAHAVDVGGGTLAEVVSGINSAGIGVTATAVNTGSGYRLQLNASSTGAASAFTVDSGLDVSSAITTTGADAVLTIGAGAGAYSITSSSNVFGEAFDGITLTAKMVSAETVTVSVGSDSDAIADKVAALVDKLNAVLSEVKSRTAYDPGTGASASLAGDSAARRVAQDLARAISGGVAHSSLGSAGNVGISLTRDGAVTFNRATFLSAYNANPAATEALFVQSGTSTGDMSFVAGGANTAEGTYEVVITQAASKALKLGMVGSLPVTVPATIRVRIGGTEIYYATSASEDAASVRAGLQDAIDAGGLKLNVSESGGGIQIESAGYGAGATFDVAWDGTTWETGTGTDVAGTINGQAATGFGQLLTANASLGDASGLAVRVTATTTGTVGTIDYQTGVAQRLSAAVSAATDSSTGYLTGAENQRQSRIDLFEDSIRSYENRLEVRETRLRAQFATLETVMGRLQSQSAFLASQLSSLNQSSDR